MVNGTTSVEVVHMMFATRENFRNVPFCSGLTLICGGQSVREWINQAEGDPAVRMDAIRIFVADTVRQAVTDSFLTAYYPGD